MSSYETRFSASSFSPDYQHIRNIIRFGSGSYDDFFIANVIIRESALKLIVYKVDIIETLRYWQPEIDPAQAKGQLPAQARSHA